LDNLPRGIGDFDMDVHMRVRPFELSYGTLEGNDGLQIKHGGAMMCSGWTNESKYCGNDHAKNGLHGAPRSFVKAPAERHR
jgi:hypothetical protein